MSTSYKLIYSSEDKKEVESFLNKAGIEFDDLKFPSVVARRGREVIGVIGTVPSDRAVIAGPIHVEVNGNQSFVLKNLITAYERILQRAGVTVYNFSLKEDNKKFLDTLERLPGLTSKNGDVKDGVIWFKRQL